MLTITMQEQVIEEVATLNDAELKAVMDYIAFLKYQPIAQETTMTEGEIGTVYAEFAEEDRAMAEEGMRDYLAGIEAEENR